jgi:hypothetical protein
MRRYSPRVWIEAADNGQLKALHDYERARYFFPNRSGHFTVQDFIAARYFAGEKSLRDKGNRSRAIQATRRAFNSSPYMIPLGDDKYRFKGLSCVMREATGRGRGPVQELRLEQVLTWAAFLDHVVSTIANNTHYSAATITKRLDISRRRFFQAIKREKERGFLRVTNRFVFEYFDTVEKAAKKARELGELHKVFISEPFKIRDDCAGITAQTSNQYNLLTSRTFKGIHKPHKAPQGVKREVGEKYFEAAHHLRHHPIKKRGGETQEQYIARKVANRRHTEARRARWGQIFPGSVLLGFGPDYSIDLYAFRNSKTMQVYA